MPQIIRSRLVIRGYDWYGKSKLCRYEEECPKFSSFSIVEFNGSRQTRLDSHRSSWIGRFVIKYGGHCKLKLKLKIFKWEWTSKIWLVGLVGSPCRPLAVGSLGLTLSWLANGGQLDFMSMVDKSVGPGEFRQSPFGLIDDHKESEMNIVSTFHDDESRERDRTQKLKVQKRKKKEYLHWHRIHN